MRRYAPGPRSGWSSSRRSEEHTSELQSQSNLVCRLLLEKKKHYEISIIAADQDARIMLEEPHTSYLPVATPGSAYLPHVMHRRAAGPLAARLPACLP